MRRALLALLITAATAAPAAAQGFKPLPRFAVDVRGFTVGLKRDPVTAADLGLPAADLPGRGVGGTLGVNLYLFRWDNFAIGVGGEGILGHGRSQSASSGATTTVEQHLRGAAVTLSLNFGHRNGWSYLSAGEGPFRFETFVVGLEPLQPPSAETTLDAGAGARWFIKDHLAFCFDIRGYYTRPSPRTATNPGRGRVTLVVLSAGLAFK